MGKCKPTISRWTSMVGPPIPSSTELRCWDEIGTATGAACRLVRYPRCSGWGRRAGQSTCRPQEQHENWDMTYSKAVHNETKTTWDTMGYQWIPWDPWDFKGIISMSGHSNQIQWCMVTCRHGVWLLGNCRTLADLGTAIVELRYHERKELCWTCYCCWLTLKDSKCAEQQRNNDQMRKQPALASVSSVKFGGNMRNHLTFQ